MSIIGNIVLFTKISVGVFELNGSLGSLKKRDYLCIYASRATSVTTGNLKVIELYAQS